MSFALFQQHNPAFHALNNNNNNNIIVIIIINNNNSA